MRKAIATTVLTLGLVFTAAPATVASGPEPVPAPCVPLIETERQFGVSLLEAVEAELSATIAAQQEKIAKQRATIRRLRDRLSR